MRRPSLTTMHIHQCLTIKWFLNLQLQVVCVSVSCWKQLYTETDYTLATTCLLAGSCYCLLLHRRRRCRLVCVSRVSLCSSSQHLESSKHCTIQTKVNFYIQYWMWRARCCGEKKFPFFFFFICFAIFAAVR